MKLVASMFRRGSLVLFCSSERSSLHYTGMKETVGLKRSCENLLHKGKTRALRTEYINSMHVMINSISVAEYWGPSRYGYIIIEK
ncbi:hypothetical protein TNCT_99451 [Trichonephila clavata]|uniref:Uncharacterized protein n=1 Tax=Trichonephila clavata TaxID=2740835 RepID=A0A8X6J4S4_TRICU|nr:hypothetical protein TNCT_99451 [Trichonephila clavata]